MRFLIFISCVLFLNMLAPVVEATPKIVVSELDKVILQQKLGKFSKEKNLGVGELMLKLGLDFKGTPYVAKTLDIGNEECLVVNLRQFDCTTFVESCLAIALTIKSKQPSFGTFATILEKIRYRNGHLDEYISRLHYFSEWIADNEAKGCVTDVTLKLGGLTYPLSLNFMGTHSNLYPQLKHNPALVNKIKVIEKKVSGKQFYYLPKDAVADHAKEMADGDIIALTTKIAGLDVTHLGLVCKKGNEVFLLNASSLGRKVEITSVPLASYLENSKNTTGVFIVRAN